MVNGSIKLQNSFESVRFTEVVLGISGGFDIPINTGLKVHPPVPEGIKNRRATEAVWLKNSPAGEVMLGLRWHLRFWQRAMLVEARGGAAVGQKQYMPILLPNQGGYEPSSSIKFAWVRWSLGSALLVPFPIDHKERWFAVGAAFYWEFGYPLLAQNTKELIHGTSQPALDGEILLPAIGVSPQDEIGLFFRVVFADSVPFFTTDYRSAPVTVKRRAPVLMPRGGLRVVF
jgi:hypothetical protein